MGNDTVNLLKECNAGVKMGVTSISRVMPHVKRGELKNSLISVRTSTLSLVTERIRCSLHIRRKPRSLI